MKRITVTPETTDTPSGNVLVKRPDNINGTWKRISVCLISSGQPRPYADSVCEAEIVFEGGCSSTKAGYDLPFHTIPTEAQVKLVTKAMVCHFTDEPKSCMDTHLSSIQCVEKAATFSRWYVKVISPFCD